jgi:hypothetical protein
MAKKFGFLTVSAFLGAFVLSSQAINVSGAVTPAANIPSPIPTSVPAETIGDKLAPQDSTQTAKDDQTETGDEDKPFAPHWTGQLGLNYSNQPGQQAIAGVTGQVTKDLTLTGTYNLAESGHFVSLGITGGQQKVEGADTNYGSFTLDGGLGLGIFFPSLSIVVQQGASALNSISSTLNLNFQVFDPLIVGLTLGGGLESHQGPVSQILGTSDAIDEIDSNSWSGGVIINFTPWNFLSLSLTAQQEYDTTYQYQTISHTNAISLNQNSRIPSITLEPDITFWKDFVLELSVQVGQEFYPAGTIYSKLLGRTVNFSTPTTQSFTGYSIGLAYNFE